MQAQVEAVCVKLQQRSSWLVLCREGTRILAHCRVCKKREGVIADLRLKPSNWSKDYHVEVHDMSWSGNLAWFKARSKVEGHAKDAQQKDLARMDRRRL